LSPEFEYLYANSGRPSIAPEYILRALLLQVFYSVRSERLLLEQIDILYPLAVIQVRSLTPSALLKAPL